MNLFLVHNLVVNRILSAVFLNVAKSSCHLRLNFLKDFSLHVFAVDALEEVFAEVGCLGLDQVL